MKVIIIDAERRKIYERITERWQDLARAVVGGNPDLSHEFRNRDCVFTHEDGLLSDNDEMFTIRGAHQPFVGNAIIVGHDKHLTPNSCRSTIDGLYKKIRFTSKDAMADSYARNKSRPSH